MKSQKLFVIALAVFLLVGASNATARVVDAWVVVGLKSASGTVTVESDVCMGATVDLINQGFRYRTMSHPEPRLAALFFLKTSFDGNTDAATLFCVYNIFEEQLGPPGLQ
jgi:hypothetical protein